jgi:hypothetical protein
LEVLQGQKESYIANNSLGDPDEVNESIVLAGRDETLLQTMNALHEAEINAIVQAIGGKCSFPMVLLG